MNEIERSLVETNYAKIRRLAAERLEADIGHFAVKYDAELDAADGDQFRVLILAEWSIQNMIAELRK